MKYFHNKCKLETPQTTSTSIGRPWTYSNKQNKLGTDSKFKFRYKTHALILVFHKSFGISIRHSYSCLLFPFPSMLIRSRPMNVLLNLKLHLYAAVLWKKFDHFLAESYLQCRSMFTQDIRFIVRASGCRFVSCNAKWSETYWVSKLACFFLFVLNCIASHWVWSHNLSPEEKKTMI